jgi:hypothetical protein
MGGIGLAVFLALVGVPNTHITVMPKYGVKVAVDKRADFSRHKTYCWSPGWAVFDRTIDESIVAAVDRELAAVGLAKRDSEPADLVVTYASLRRTDVDLRAKKPPGSLVYPEYPVGTLIVLVREPVTLRELYRARADIKLETDPSKLQGQFDDVVAQMFERYPTRKPRQ